MLMFIVCMLVYIRVYMYTIVYVDVYHVYIGFTFIHTGWYVYTEFLCLLIINCLC